MMFLNKDEGSANENLFRLKLQRDVLPVYLQQKYVVDEDGEIKVGKGSDNVRSLSNCYNGTKIVTKASAKSQSAAEKVGRGSTQAIQYYDEFEFTDHIYTILTAAGPAFNTASDNAKRNFSPYCRIFTTTPGDLDSEPVKTTNNFRSQMFKFTEQLYDVHPIIAANIITTNSKNSVVYIEYQYKQLGKDEEWFQKICKFLDNNRTKIKREVFLQRIRGNSNSPFEQADLEAINDLKGTAIEDILIYKIFPITVYTKLDPTIPYIVGVDVATGSGADNTAVTIFNPYTQKPVAEFKSAIAGIENIKRFLFTLIKKFIPNGILCIERNSIGEAVIDGLKNTAVGHRLYFDNNKYFIPSADDKLDEKGFLEVEAKNRKSYGVYTSTKTRGIMFDILMRHVAEFKDRFIGNNLIDDLNNLVRRTNGSIAAASGAHDDSVMSYLIALFVFYHGTNLSRYGLVKGAEAPPPEIERSYEENLEA